MSLIKRVYTDEETIITAKNLNDIQDAVIGLEDGLFTIDNTKSGEVITITDAYKRGFRSLSIYGKTTQDGTPTPDAPADLVNVGDNGSIIVNVSGTNDNRAMNISTPNGLPGIPVSSGGNYTDANGQQWICDEIDFARGVYIQRILPVVPDKAKFGGVKDGETVFGGITTDRQIVVGSSVLATHLPAAKSYIASSNQTVGVYAYSEWELRFRISGTNTTNEITEFIDNNSVEFYCVLTIPIETPLPEEELAAFAALHTYKDSTTVSNDAGAWMELEYVMDSKKYIDSKLVSGSILPATVE